MKVLFSSEHRNTLFLNLLITFGGGAGYYLTSGYLPSLLKVVNSIPNNVSSLILMSASVAALFSAVLVEGSQRFHRPQEDVPGGRGLHAGAAAAVLSQHGQVTDTATITLYALAIAFIGNAGYRRC